jgi:hypothetical protein
LKRIFFAKKSVSKNSFLRRGFKTFDTPLRIHSL